MNVMQRPLFRQAGGPVAPQMAAPMPQQQMPMDPALMDQASMIQNTVADQANTMTAEYIQNQLAQLDNAETSEQAINAIRGNEKSIEERYRELAELVGEEDAGQTPQSVLTLVQPVMLMTEQGAMDSGLGQLMQGLIGEVDMMTEGGQPTDMGQGIGSLMMAGAAEEPMGVGQQPVANFSQGGAVQRFQEGGEASRLQQIYSEMLPVYQSILGDLDERRRLTQSQILFDIADRAGAFAAGIDPRTGQRISGSPAAQLAGAMSGLGGQIGERLGSLEEADQRLRLAALQGAQSEYSAERAAARAAAGRERALGNFYDIRDANGNVVDRIPLATQSDYEAARARIPEGGSIQPSRFDTEGDFVTLIDPNNPMNIQQVRQGSSEESQARMMGFVEPAVASTLRELTQDPDKDIRIIGGNAVDLTDPANPVVVFQSAPEQDIRSVGGALVDVTNPANPVVVYQGAQERDLRTVDNRVIDFTDPANPVTLYEPEPAAPSGNFVNVETADGEVISLREDDPRLDQAVTAGGRIVSRTGPTTPTDPLLDPASMEAYAAGTASDDLTLAIQDAIAQRSRLVYNPETGRNERPTLPPVVLQAERARAERGESTAIQFAEEREPIANVQEGLDRLEEFGGAAFGTDAFIRNLGNKIFAIADANAPFPEQQEGINLVVNLNETAKLAFRDLTTGRPAQDSVDQFAENFPDAATIAGSPGTAASEIRAQLDYWNREMSQSEQALASGILSASDRAKVEAGLIASRDMIAAYQALLRGIQQRSGEGNVDPAQFRR